MGSLPIQPGSSGASVPRAQSNGPVESDDMLGWGVLVLAGSSGWLDVHAARPLARAGAIALAQRWFGQPGLPAGTLTVEPITWTRNWGGGMGCDRRIYAGNEVNASDRMASNVAAVSMAPDDRVKPTNHGSLRFAAHTGR